MENVKEWYTLLEAAKLLGKSKSSIEYHARSLNATDRTTDENGLILISHDALVRIKRKMRTSTQEAPKKHITSTEEAPKMQDASEEEVPHKYLTSTQEALEIALENATRRAESAEQQLRAKDEQIKAMQRTIDSMTAGVATAQALLSIAMQPDAVHHNEDIKKPDAPAEAVTVDAVHHNDGVAKREVVVDASKSHAGNHHHAPDRQRKPERKSGLLASLFGKKSRK